MCYVRRVTPKEVLLGKTLVARREVFAASSIKFCVLEYDGVLFGNYRRFGGICCLHVQGSARRYTEDIAGISSEMSITNYKSK